jgi:hypothetical protein
MKSEVRRTGALIALRKPSGLQRMRDIIGIQASFDLLIIAMAGIHSQMELASLKIEQERKGRARY